MCVCRCIANKRYSEELARREEYRTKQPNRAAWQQCEGAQARVRVWRGETHGACAWCGSSARQCRLRGLVCALLRAQYTAVCLNASMLVGIEWRFGLMLSVVRCVHNDIPRRRSGGVGMYAVFGKRVRRRYGSVRAGCSVSR